METPAWILVIFLSCALLLFLALGIVLLVKIIGITKEVKKIIITSQGIAENVRDMSSVGGLVKHFVNAYTRSKNKSNHKGDNNHGKAEKK